MSYLPIAILGYCLNAIATLVDKALLDKNIPEPIVYTFYLGVLSLAAILLIPFGFSWPNTPTILFATASGFTFVFGWMTLYLALKHDEASRVAPIIGTFVPIFTLILGLLFLDQSLTRSQFLAFAILTSGLVLISSTSWFKSKIERENILLMILSGLFFALSSVLLRQSFLNSNFISTLVVSRIGMFILVLTFLLIPKYRQKIFSSKVTGHHLINPTSKLLVLGQVAGALGGLLLTYSVSLVNPAIVNAISGVQYIIILAVVLILSKKFQKLLEEDVNKRILAQKILGSVVIGLGLAILALG